MFLAPKAWIRVSFAESPVIDVSQNIQLTRNTNGGFQLNLGLLGLGAMACVRKKKKKTWVAVFARGAAYLDTVGKGQDEPVRGTNRHDRVRVEPHSAAAGRSGSRSSGSGRDTRHGVIASAGGGLETVCCGRAVRPRRGTAARGLPRSEASALAVEELNLRTRAYNLLASGSVWKPYFTLKLGLGGVRRTVRAG